MIQRIQSIYLLLIAVCFSILLFFPLATIDPNYEYSLWSLRSVEGMVKAPTYYLGLLAIVISGIALYTIFVYKKRMTQSKLCVAMFLLMLIFLTLMFFVYPEYVIAKFLGDNAIVNYSYIAILSVLPMAFVLLANRAILKDEQKVRAADRLR
ncbi:MAG: DUF4293 domain-containing protein [Bacteroidota bacterium]|jgi:cytochrome bd-type quinol oxidase subunit 2